ncbi:hypothetical protein BGZ52_011116 [Haplosporangium bisporale]|nr:hypothetical protein BGZ52_011116 [Haplosporangium bisporale]KAF9211500.1 hypothetical protein BGZ59_007981 [Podila verticillata]KFH64811.1 hypothetical protein MVEG_09541 [Podila verticillata NRRL 6337]
MIAALTKSSVALRAPLQAAARRQFSARKPSSHETVEPTKLVGITLTRNQKIVLGVALAGGCAAESTFWYNYFFGKSEESKGESAQLTESQE